LPLVLVGAFIWLPTAVSVALSAFAWDGIGGLERMRFVGLGNYVDLASVHPSFWRAIVNNLIWLAGLGLVATPLGVLLAVLLDRRLRGAAFYESAFYLPVVLSLALVGFIWQLQYAPDHGFLNQLLGTHGLGSQIDWLGDRDINIWAALVAGGWRHVGYVTLLYLAALRSTDPTLGEAAAIDGAGEWQSFRHVTFPVLRPVNAVIIVVTAIEALRTFDIPWVINRGQNGLEVLSTVVANALLAEATRIGAASAAATVLLVVSVLPIALYLRRAVRETPA
jgi:multiple sugar transport system permease protein